MQSSKVLDNLMALRILHMLVTPFEKTDAFKLGIIDINGTPLRRASMLKTKKETEAYTYLHRLVFRLKRIIEKVPVSNKQFLSYAAAFALIREQEEGIIPAAADFEVRLMIGSVVPDEDTISLVEKFMQGKLIMPFKLFVEEGEAAGCAPANNIAATPGIAIPDPARLGKKSIWRRKNEKDSEKSDK